MSQGQERKMSQFPDSQISCCAFWYQAEAVVSDLCVTCTNLLQSPFISRTKNISNYGKNKIGIPSQGNKWNQKNCKRNGFFGYEEMEGSKKSKILIDDVQNMASAKER